MTSKSCEHCYHWWDGDGPCCRCGWDGDEEQSRLSGMTQFYRNWHHVIGMSSQGCSLLLFLALLVLTILFADVTYP